MRRGEGRRWGHFQASHGKDCQTVVRWRRREAARACDVKVSMFYFLIFAVPFMRKDTRIVGSRATGDRRAKREHLPTSAQ